MKCDAMTCKQASQCDLSLYFWTKKKQEQCDHSFKEAMKLEAVNLLSPENIHVVTVTGVKGQYIWLSLEGERR